MRKASKLTPSGNVASKIYTTPSKMIAQLKKRFMQRILDFLFKLQPPFQWPQFIFECNFTYKYPVNLLLVRNVKSTWLSKGIKHRLSSTIWFLRRSGIGWKRFWSLKVFISFNTHKISKHKHNLQYPYAMIFLEYRASVVFI